ncbi:MAG: hypothetical protein FWE50_02725 [Alphaproteobacteria bacterium]|nr:hypothetical protein [Alphaproteobacteria bacterium]
MRGLCIFTLLLFSPCAVWPSPRSESPASPRASDNSASVSSPFSIYSDAYSDVMVIVRALMPARTPPGGGKGSSPRLQNPGGQVGQTSSASGQDQVIQTKLQYINFLKNSSMGSQNDCADKYAKFNNFFRHESSLSGQISAKGSGSNYGRLDTICEFLDYGHWCFALGFAYAVRDFEDNIRVSRGNKCFTYQEFCESNRKLLDNSKIDEYLSRIIDEIMFYNTNIRNTDKNTVMIVTEQRTGPSVTTSTSWKGYDTDSWVQERIPVSEMTRLLCK